MRRGCSFYFFCSVFHPKNGDDDETVALPGPDSSEQVKGRLTSSSFRGKELMTWHQISRFMEI